MTRRHGLLSTLALIATGAVVGLLVVACGIRPSGVILGQEAPHGAVTSLIVYLLDHNSLRAVSRPLPPPVTAKATDGSDGFYYPPGPGQQALDQLAKGPTATEASGGLTSDIPSNTFLSTPSQYDTHLFRVFVKSNQPQPLSQHAVDQIACTMITAVTNSGADHDNDYKVQVFDGVKQWPSQGCPLTTP